MGMREKLEVEGLNSVRLEGSSLTNAQTGTTNSVKILLYDDQFDILLATGTDVPANDTNRYAKGCLFIERDVATGTSGVYENVGTRTDCLFQRVGLGAGGVAASHVVVFSGEFTWSGSGASVGETVTGALATDIVQATIQSAPTQAAYIASAAATADTVTITLSAANTSNDAVIAYTVLRAGSSYFKESL